MDQYAELMVNFSFGAIGYLILALLLQSGFPPFYRPWKFRPESQPSEKEIQDHLPFVFGLFGMFLGFALTELHLFLVGAGILAIWGGLRIRRDLYKLTGGPLPWAENYWTLKWPMLVFDLWTVGLGVGLGFF